MKLRNKKTREICDFKIIADYDDCTSGWRLEKHDGTVLFYDHIDEIHDEWEDVLGEPEEYWCIDWTESGVFKTTFRNKLDEFNAAIGNMFKSEKEAEEAIEKLKAWKRLKDKGLKANRTEISGDSFICEFILPDHSDYSRSIDDFELALGLEYEK